MFVTPPPVSKAAILAALTYNDIISDAGNDAFQMDLTGKRLVNTAGTDLFLGLDTEVSKASSYQNYVLHRTMTMGVTPPNGELKVYSENKVTDSQDRYSDVRVNGVSVGTIKHTNGTAYLSRTDMLTGIEKGDVITFYVRLDFNSRTTYLKNVRILGTVEEETVSSTVIV